jgi:NAD(P)H-nitrite reductase large subunit
VAGGCGSVEAVGRTLRAGTNCGSCRPEIARLIATSAAAADPALAAGRRIASGTTP